MWMIEWAQILSNNSEKPSRCDSRWVRGGSAGQTFGPELGQVAAQGGEAVVSVGATQGLGGLGVQFLVVKVLAAAIWEN
jgi:hypothetical protein